jgi:hypothetical protein
MSLTWSKGHTPVRWVIGETGTNQSERGSFVVPQDAQITKPSSAFSTPPEMLQSRHFLAAGLVRP